MKSQETKTVVLQNAQTTGNGGTFEMDECRDAVIYIRSNGTTTAGAVQVEEDFDGTATTWAAIGSAITVTGTNNVQAVHLSSGCYVRVRARISTTVTGGTVTCTAVGRQF